MLKTECYLIKIKHMENNCSGCGAKDYTDYGNEYACNYCGSSGFKTEGNDFSEKEREFLASNGFRQKSQTSYIKSTKTIDFVIYRLNIGNSRFCYEVSKKDFFRTRITPVTVIDGGELKDYVFVFQKEYKNPASVS